MNESRLKEVKRKKKEKEIICYKKERKKERKKEGKKEGKKKE